MVVVVVVVVGRLVGLVGVTVTRQRKGQTGPGPLRVTADFSEMVCSLVCPLARQVFSLQIGLLSNSQCREKDREQPTLFK